MAVASIVSGAAAQDADVVFEQIEITGSRIPAMDNDVSVHPVSVLNEESLRLSGVLLASEALNQMPQLGDAQEGGSSINSLNSGFGVGTQTVNLRNMGAKRTLVLVNGRRHVGGDVGTASVDLNSIPMGLVDRIEVLTGGASAVYGADAVTGVVNVILKEEFVGSELNVRTAQTSESDGEETALSFTKGSIFEGGDYVFSVEYSAQEPILGRDRDFSQFDGSALTGLSDPGNGSTVVPNGSYVSPTLGNGGFDDSGNYVANLTPGSFQRAPFRSLQNENDRLLVSGHINFYLNETAELFVESTYSNTVTTVQFDPQFAIFNDAGFASSGTAGFRFPTAPTVSVDGTTTQKDLDGDLRAVSRRFLEYGARESEVDRTLVRFATGINGSLNNSEYEIYYQYGHVDTTQTDFNTIDKLRFITAIDPGACAATSGCIFADIYGLGTLDPASLAYVADDLESDSESTQHVLGGFITGEAFAFRGDMARYVLGLEYRDESATIKPNDGLIAVEDPITGSGNLVGLTGTRTFFGDTKGDYDVAEVFGELKLPVTESFDLGFSAYFSEYSTVDSEFNYGVNGNLILTDKVRLRASAGSATRAPNIGELFTPDTVATVGIADPCDTATDAGETLPTAANCSQFVGDNFNPSDLDQQIRGVTGGNKELDSETAITATLGVVFTLSESSFVSLDYFTIDMEDVLADAFSAQDTLERCVGTLNSTFCRNVTRDPATGIVTSVRSEQVNLAEEAVSGIELAFNHTWATSVGDLNWSGIYTHLLEHTRKVNDTAKEEDLAGRVDNIENKINTSLKFSRESWYAGLTMRYLDSAVQSINADPSVALGNKIDSIVYTDLFGGFQATDQLQIGAGIENIGDEESPVVTQLFENTGSADTTASGIYDIRGRFFYLGATYRF